MNISECVVVRWETSFSNMYLLFVHLHFKQHQANINVRWSNYLAGPACGYLRLGDSVGMVAERDIEVTCVDGSPSWICREVMCHFFQDLCIRAVRVWTKIMNDWMMCSRMKMQTWREIKGAQLSLWPGKVWGNSHVAKLAGWRVGDDVRVFNFGAWSIAFNP